MTSASTNHRARIVLIENNALLLMHRLKSGREFYSFPGGGIEEGETPENAAVRETKEETGLTVTVIKKLWEIESVGRREYFFLVKKTGGIIMLGGPEKERQSENNVYALEWIPLEKLGSLTVFPEETKQKITELVL
jgi:8-oxo-dGTP pyrophosphatase MutT (NUDIX family)